ncbi:MAG: type IV pilus assembly protein PilC [Acidimicrobiales bacterium]|jgi:type IV pilus assembly protein PilC
MGIFNKVSVQDQAQFANNLSVMLKSGITIDQALETLAELAASPYFKKSIMNVSESVRNGTLLSVSFSNERKVFGDIFVSLVAAGEESGTLRENLTFLADWFERAADLKREVDGATLYPKLVFGATVLLGGALAVLILPRLMSLFGRLDVELPLITKILLSVSTFLQAQWLWCILGVVMTVVFLAIIKRFPKVRYFLDTLQIYTPFIGPILLQYQLALMTQLFATLLHSGLPITQSIEVVRKAVPNQRFKESVTTMEQSAVSGKTLSQAMKQYPRLYPAMCIGIVSVGEQSGTLSDSFGYLTEFYTKEVKAKAKQLPTIIEPILLIFTAMVVGMVALAIILPIYKLTGSIN